jgi:uncharacterized protein (DUF362 family)
MSHPEPHPHLHAHPHGHAHGSSRRAFLRRGARLAAALAAAGAAGALLWNRRPPGDFSRAAALPPLPDFTAGGPGPAMSIVTGGGRVPALQRALAALGGIERFVKRGDRVLLKVNAAFASPASLGATTHPELAAELIRLCLKAGAASVVVTDNPINAPDSCFALSGLAEATARAGGRLIVPRDPDFLPSSVPNARLLRDWPVLRRPLEGITKLIGVAPVKSHNRAVASMTMKNWYGLLGGRRNQFHQDIHGIVSELSSLVRPTFVVLDGTESMMANGPTGGSLDDLKATRTLVVSTDMVAADAFGCSLLDKAPADLPYLRLAEARGSGRVDFEALHPLRISLA